MFGEFLLHIFKESIKNIFSVTAITPKRQYVCFKTLRRRRIKGLNTRSTTFYYIPLYIRWDEIKRFQKLKNV